MSVLSSLLTIVGASGVSRAVDSQDVGGAVFAQWLLYTGYPGEQGEVANGLATSCCIRKPLLRQCRDLLLS
jgi:hypothetical protein